MRAVLTLLACRQVVAFTSTVSFGIISSSSFKTIRRNGAGVAPTRTISTRSSPWHMGKPKSGSIVDSYQTVSVNCSKCKTRLFRYKKKNGTKSNLIKCYIERISQDCEGVLERKANIQTDRNTDDDITNDWNCPKCDTKFGTDSLIHGRPAIKLVGGKTTMTKK
jgi:hypothetical protein